MIEFDPQKVLTLLQKCPEYQSTPLIEHRELTTLMGCERFWVKDERSRMSLGSFKALGGAYAVYCLMQQGAGPIFCCASAGNHGLSVAAGARAFGAEAVVILSQAVPQSFEAQIRELGAQVIRHGDTYEESMKFALSESAERGWELVSDSSWEGYTETPRLVMEGYTVIAWEMAQEFQKQGAWPTLLYLQAGVGGLAAALTSEIRRSWPEQPQIIVVEPGAAPCLRESVKQDRLITISGPSSVMGRLDCKEPSLLAFEILRTQADGFVTVPDKLTQTVCGRLEKFGLHTTPSAAAGLTAAYRSWLPGEARVLTVLTEHFV